MSEVRCQMFCLLFSAFRLLSSVFYRRRIREWDLCLSYGESVNRSLVFEVFAFEVCADPFAGIGTGSGQKINLLQFIIPGSQNRLYLFKIVGVVGGDF